MSKYLRLLLLPFTLIYGLIIFIRNMLFDFGILKSTSSAIPLICVGNIAVGGSGKTPVTEYLVELLKEKRIAILSRGYGRKTKGFILADENSNAGSIGDEPLQYYRKFPDVTVAVCEDRVKGVSQLKDAHDVIILDDAFQHRKIAPGFSVLLFEYHKLFETQWLLPAGNLREFFRAYKRADAIMVTKSPSKELPDQIAKVKAKFHEMNDSNIFFSTIVYDELLPVFSGKENFKLTQSASIHLITGIANPVPLLNHLEKASNIILHHEYPDHYQFTAKDIVKLVSGFKDDQAEFKIILTTEKDSQRLMDAPIKELLLDLPVFYIPIHFELRNSDKTLFDQMILDYVSGTTRNR